MGQAWRAALPGPGTPGVGFQKPARESAAQRRARRHARAAGLHRAVKLLQRAHSALERQHMRAARGLRQRQRMAKAARGAGDENDGVSSVHGGDYGVGLRGGGGGGDIVDVAWRAEYNAIIRSNPRLLLVQSRPLELCQNI